MSLSSYLYKRPGSQNWYARMMVPQKARSIVGKCEFVKSLRTPDRRAAERAAYPIIADWTQQLEALSAPQASPAELIEPTDSEIQEAALHMGYEEAGRRLQSLISRKLTSGPSALTALANDFERRRLESLRGLLTGENSIWVERAKATVAKRRWHLPEDSDGFRRLVELLAKCGTDLFARAKAIVDGRDEAFVPSETVRALTRQREERAAQGEHMLALFDTYAAQRLAEGKKRKDTLEQDRKSVALFADFVGENRSLRSVKASEVREWRNAVACLPPGMRKRREFAGKSLREAVAYAKTARLKPISLITVNKMLSAISALFSWAKREGYVESNPCDGLYYDANKGANARPPFEAASLNQILRSPLFTGFLRAGKEFLPGGVKTRDWRFWIPLLCLFTGARVGELAHLYVDDVSQDNGHWYIRISHNAARGQTTKSGVSRIAPIHSKLVAIGFIDFVAARMKGAGTGDVRLFPDLERNERGQSGKASRFWRDYLRRIGVKSGADGYGSHSFRHGLADQLRLAGYLDDEIEVALGHNQKTVTSGYGKIKQGTIGRLSKMIEQATFEGVSFVHLEQQVLAPTDNVEC